VRAKRQAAETTMTTESTPHAKPDLSELPLRPGQRLDQPTFHRLYEQVPNDVKFELIAGVVHMPSPMRAPHGRHQLLLNACVGWYWTETPGTDIGDNTTVILGDDCEPQPDALLRIIDGQSHENDEEYLVGPPEWLGEVSDSSRDYDLHAKRDDYERYGVQEYLVLVVREKRAVRWVREGDKFAERPADDDGILRSAVFPGLWLDVEAFFRRDGRRLKEVLEMGLATPEHAAFVGRLRRSAAK
ncbi:MAG: Uma2 family endonuclease, partial [Vicinamibacterales bacterium]